MAENEDISIEPLVNVTNGHDPVTGKFIRGNKGGPGNPNCKRVQELRKVILDASTPECMRIVWDKLIEECKKGSVNHLTLFLSYTLGKPKQEIDVKMDQLNPEQISQKIAVLFGINTDNVTIQNSE